MLLAETYELGGDLERARRLVEQAVAEFTGLLALDAGNARWRRGLGASTKELAEINVHSGRTDAALAGIDEALTLFGRMAADDSSSADIQQQIASSLNVQAAALEAVGRLVAQLRDAGCRHPAYADVLGLAADSP